MHPLSKNHRRVAVIALLISLPFCRPMPGRAADKAGESELHKRLTADEIATGWISLFDGRTMFGWKANNDVNWQIVDGVVRADTGDPGLLVTATEFADS